MIVERTKLGVIDRKIDEDSAFRIQHLRLSFGDVSLFLPTMLLSPVSFFLL